MRKRGIEVGTIAIASVMTFLGLEASGAEVQGSAPRQLGPCQRIEMACENAGFKREGGTEGDRAWLDCVVPIVQGGAGSASSKALPRIDPELKASCLEAQPSLRKLPSEPPAKTASTARGIIVWPSPWSMKNGDLDKAIAVPGVDGLGVHVTWAEISPAFRKYDFTAIDRQLALAQSHHLAVELAVAAGKGNPAWLFEKPPLGPGLRRLDFAMSYHGGDEPCQQGSMPPPWEPGYQEAYADMLAQLAEHLRATGYDRDVAAIKLTGINTLTEELALPNASPTDSGTPSRCLTDAPRIWQQAGYRPSLVVKAMAGIAASYQRYFPDTLVTLPIIVMFAFPPIDESGRVTTRAQALGVNDKLLNDLVRTAAKALPGHFAVQDCFLIADLPADQRTVGLARANGVGVAWQTNIWFGKYGKGAACGGRGQGFLDRMLSATPCDENSFLQMLRRGMHPQGGEGPSSKGLFVEVFPSDVVAFPTAIKTAHDEWKR